MNRQMIIAAAIMGAGFMGKAAASPVPQAPEAVRAPAGHELSLVLYATGVQVYECAQQDADAFAWKFKGPVADLTDRAGKPMGRHYGGPTWESQDGSKVVARVSARADAADSRAIPLLLLEARSTGGPGMLAGVRSIQRLDTVGGTAPAQGCNRESLAREARVPYTATYYFYSKPRVATTSAAQVCEWNGKLNQAITEAKMGTPPAIRVSALVQTAVHEAVSNAARAGASVEAAMAVAHGTVLAKVIPVQQAAVAAAQEAALARIAEGAAKAAGVKIGEEAARAVLAARADDMPGGGDDYRPYAGAGAYVPTASPAVPKWGQRKPWLMGNAAQFRPAAPPALTSAAWQRDYDEVKSVGARNSSTRTPEQTEIARFWEYSLPAIYFGAACSMASKPGRDAVANSRMLAAAAQAMDDALIAVFDAKYHYGFWRPVTAIRNGDLDGHAGTERQGDWAPLIDAPMHPEYPSGHSILAASVGAVLASEFGGEGAGPLATSSPTAKGAMRKWSTIADFVREVSSARVYAGIHFRTATEVGAEMGGRIGSLAASATRASVASATSQR